MSSQRSRLTLKNETKFLLSFNESKSRLENFIRFVIISKHVKFVEHFLQYLAAKNNCQFLAVETQDMSGNIQCRLMDFRVYLFTIRGHPHKDSDICVVQSTN